MIYFENRKDWAHDNEKEKEEKERGPIGSSWESASGTTKRRRIGRREDGRRRAWSNMKQVGGGRKIGLRLDIY